MCLPHQFVDVLLYVLFLNRSCCAYLSGKLNPEVQSTCLAVLGLVKNLYEFVEQATLVDFKNYVFAQFDMTEKFENVFGIEVEFEEFDEHGDESLFKEGVDAFDAVAEDVDDEDV